MLIGLTGYKFSGKDTVGNYLCDKYDFKRLAFADPLKKACHDIFGFNDEQLYGSKKEDIDEFWGVNPRQIFQFVGTELFRNQMKNIIPDIGNDVWVKSMEKQILDIENINVNLVITDIRFQNELDIIKKYGGVIIRVLRNDNNDNHESEKNIDQLTVDFELTNKSTLDDLYLKIDILVPKIKN